MKESDITNSEVDRIKACVNVFKRATEILLRLQDSISRPLFETSSVGDVSAFTVLKRADDVVHNARPILTAAYSALVEYRKEMEQVQVQHPGLVVTYPQYLGDILCEAAGIDLKALQTGATAINFDTTTLAVLSEAVKIARHYRSYGNI